MNVAASILADIIKKENDKKLQISDKCEALAKKPSSTIKPADLEEVEDFLFNDLQDHMSKNLSEEEAKNEKED